MNGLSSPDIAALVSYCGFGLWLSIYDIRHHRLPNREVLTLAIVLLMIATLSPGFFRTLTFALFHTLIYTVMFFVSRGQLGMGDVKYAFPTGLLGGIFHVDVWTAVVIVFAIAGCVSLVLVMMRVATWQSRIAFGPFMTVGILVAVALTHYIR